MYTIVEEVSKNRCLGSCIGHTLPIYYLAMEEDEEPAVASGKSEGGAWLMQNMLRHMVLAACGVSAPPSL